MRFDQKVAVVTGGSRGIGFAIAKELIAGGATVIITGRKQDSLDAALEQLGDRARGVAGKLGQPEHDDALRRAITDEFGGIDYLVNNVGMNPVFGPLVQLDLDVARKILDTNVLGALKMSRLGYELGLRERRGAIVNVGSISGLRPSTGIGMYGVSKSALFALTRQLAVEFAPNIRVNAVAPAAIKTDFSKAMYEGREAELAAAYPAERIGVPEDVAGPVCFFLSDAAGWVTGQTLAIDGGLSLVTP
ncbi:SDR family oxidoreductase [Gulosibacter molinativorax]|uniref:SDR family NAD(P)-dependent oxidoreductase n=1 Tax=Gulosibacter molinativorax TaxID=256821 RepID=A0ABT7CBA8_9MICO|nr:SDR family oxidoreductase [Gulosibacter molinativorax]MDJ1372474.1 SDR family NAD(P)-dependent oxidoreductase [Gulosibacter molinativorax]QUY61949.1 3-ketoacyl-(Acyl-carrier-protein) reductase [Gulosibacter molinativorax]